MEPLAFIRRSLVGLLGTALGALLLAAAARAEEVGGAAVDAARGLAVHDAEETLRDYCRPDADGRLWLELPGGARFELVTSTADPAIANPGDGSFHPFEHAEVDAALADQRYPLTGIAADVFVLPYPRRAGLESAAGPGLILLSPGVRTLSHEQQHAELVHELGHVVQYARLPDADVGAWVAYRRLRGIEDVNQFSATSPHERRPHEIFAEDFRALFGGAAANYSGTIENAELTPPEQVPGLREFLLGLAVRVPAPGLAVFPNPTRGALTFARAAVVSAPLEVFDVNGRRIALVPPLSVGASTVWRWNGRDAAGRPAGPGMLFVRVRGESGLAARVTLLP